MLSINLNNPLTTTTTAADYRFLKTHYSIPQMALRVHFLFPKHPSQTPKFQSHPFPTKPPQRLQISSKKNPSDAELASELASEVLKINTLLVQKQEAMKKSREILFAELCQHMGMSDSEVKRKWMNMEEDEKGSLVKGFVLEWGASFHPLSVKSVKELVDEYLVQDESKSSALPSDSSSGGSMLFPSLKKLMGFSQNE